MFGKKSKKWNEVDPPVLPNDLAEHASALAGMSTEELIKLFESLERIDDSIVVSRRRPVPGKNTSKEVGGRQRKMPIHTAIDYEKKRGEERAEKERQIKEFHGIDPGDFQRDEINDEIYPKRLAPNDIVRSIEAAKERLEENDRLRSQKRKVYSTREEIVLDILTLVKKNEASRVARRIAERQREAVVGKSDEELQAQYEMRMQKLRGEPEPIVETPEEKEERIQREEEEKQAAIRSLPGFGRNIKTLVDEVGDLTEENIDAAAAIVRQWIGNVVKMEN